MAKQGDPLPPPNSEDHTSAGKEHNGPHTCPGVWLELAALGSGCQWRWSYAARWCSRAVRSGHTWKSFCALIRLWSAYFQNQTQFPFQILRYQFKVRCIHSVDQWLSMRMVQTMHLCPAGFALSFWWMSATHEDTAHLFKIKAIGIWTILAMVTRA